MLSLFLILLLFKETLSKLSVTFCILPSVVPISEELIRLRHGKVVNCAGSERMVKPGIKTKLTLVRLEAALTWILKVVP